MNARQRSLSGLILAIILLPVLAGLLACFDLMPVPLGDPEKSRVDHGLDGMWLAEYEAVWLLEPFDEHAWLITVYDIDTEDCEAAGEEAAGEEVDAAAESPDQTETEPPAEDEIQEIIEIEPIEDKYAYEIAELRAVDPDCVAGEIDSFFKVWSTTIGPAEFLTFEEKGMFDEDSGFVPGEWLVFRLVRKGGDELHLRWLDSEYEGFDEPELQARLQELADKGPGDARALKSARRAVERMIRRNLDDDDLYLDDAEIVLFRIKPEDYDVFVDQVVPSPE